VQPVRKQEGQSIWESKQSEADTRIQIYLTAIVSVTVRLYVNQSVSEGRGNMRDVLAIIMLDKNGQYCELGSKQERRKQF
jgi:hypothetical protein